MHWSDKLAQEVIAECKSRGLDVATCRSGQSPSGAKHIGNAVDNIRSFFVARTAQEKLGFKARHIQTHDDLDPLRKVPSKLYDLEGVPHIITPAQKADLDKHVGRPYVHVPDPFGCCESWALHFSRLLEKGFSMLGLETRYDSSHDYLHQGLYEPYIKKAFSKIDLVRKIMATHQKRRSFTNYYPFDVICHNCGKISGVTTAVDTDNKTVKYTCEKRVLANEYEVAGCGHSGEATWQEGKLPWRFEWPAQWAIVNAVFEPVGKEHQEGSWPSGVEIAEKIYGTKPPIPLFNEFFLLEGKKIATRHGNTYVIQEVLRVVEPEPFLYLYAKNPVKARDISLQHIYRMTDEYDHAERVYLGLEGEANEREAENAKRSYELATRVVPRKPMCHIPYTLCATAAQLASSREAALELIRQSGHLKNATKDEEEIAWKRVQLAKKWIELYAPAEYKTNVNEIVPHDIANTFSEGQKKALRILAEELGRPKKWTEEDLQARVYALKDEVGVPAKEIFAALYSALLNKPTGPRAGLLIKVLGEKRVRSILQSV